MSDESWKFFRYTDMALEILVNIGLGSGNGLLPNDTKPLPETILIYHQRVLSAAAWWIIWKKW